MRKLLVVLSMALLALSSTSYATNHSSQQSIFSSGTYKTINGGRIFIPSSNGVGVNHSPLNNLIQEPNQNRAHTNTLYLVPDAGTKTAQTGFPPGKSPASLRKVYGISSPNGAGQVIAIVGAFDDVSAANNLNVYSKTFGLPTANFEKIYASATGGHRIGTAPRPNPGWAGESNLDIQMAHAMAPKAKIVLVEASYPSIPVMFSAVQLATSIVQKNGGGIVSMSWTASEAASDIANNQFFNHKAIYVGATGDDGLRSGYPATSPYVVSAGGTKIINDTTQVAWSYSRQNNWGGSGGTSRFQVEPAYQYSNKDVRTIVHDKRGTPDLSANADPFTGAAVYEGQDGWQVVGGTSESAPLLSGIIANANIRNISSIQFMQHIYQAPASSWYDVTYGENRLGEKAQRGYDLVTGLGAPKGISGFKGAF